MEYGELYLFQAFKSAIIIRLYKKKGTLPFVTIIMVYLSS